MELRHIPWEGDRAPGENRLKRSLEAEGWEVFAWHDPSHRVYDDHHHECDESLWVVRGEMRFWVEGREYALGPGDRLMLPQGTVHSARAGPDGARYLIGQRRDPR